MIVRKQAALILGCVVSAVAGAVYAELQTGYYRASELGTMEQAAAVKPSTDSTYAVSAYPAHEPELALGDGQRETQSECGRCHSRRYITMQAALPPATWEAEVNKMVKTYGAKITEEQSKRITQYLQAHYTPETRAR